ncbi:AbrB/MazE/SpoVT family DNA-binding domain-containing protein [Persephonella sp.]|uniref:AbrB/MazE/SpoVT family DNA-binding domain-containing protein n=1 Tax=Persephonella sp. TaxID=2060922 RepID=UPI0025E4216C|nr:AbrB/MazE/SpoVT family DNA-binding domain-containing protein [Persephonella sp.]
MFITKMTKKGQITIPAEYRKKLKAEYYTVEIKDEQIILKPFKQLAGSLKKYAKKGRIEKVIQEEKKAFREALIEKHKSD